MLELRGGWGARDAREQILPLVVALNVDVVAVSWGPYGKTITADIACRGIQALDVGRLLWNFWGQMILDFADQPDDVKELLRPN